jgi:hypothetical protein
LAIVGFVLVGPWLVAMVGRGVARLSRSVPSLLAARRIADNPQATFYSVAAVGLAAVALAYIGCTVAVNTPPNPSGVIPPFDGPARPGVVSVVTGGVPAATVEPLLSNGAIALDGGFSTAACADLARMTYVTCPYPPGGELVEPPAGTVVPALVMLLYIPTDGSLAAENRVRTEAANLVPNAIINSNRDPVDYNLETFFRDLDLFAVVAAFFVLIIGAFGLAASMVGGLIERRRPFALLRASGVYLSELRRSVLLETAATMGVVSVAGVGIGMLLAYASTRQGGMAWRWPGADVYGLIGGGVLAALLFSTVALPLLNLTTRHDAVRFE